MRQIDAYDGIDLTAQIDDPAGKRDCVFMQISESQCGRSMRMTESI